MKKLLKRFYHHTLLGKILLKPIKKIYDYSRFYLVPERIYIKSKFKKSFGYELDLNNPVTLNEKIQWLKLHDRTSLHTLCADKYAVRDYIRKIIGEEYLVPLIFQTINPYDIIPIENIYESFLNELKPVFAETSFGVAEENIQSRTRGNLLMAIANR